MSRFLNSPWLCALGLTVSAIFVFAASFLVQNQGAPVWWSDSYEYAQVARNIVEGAGIVTFAPHVLEAWILQDLNLPLPYFFHDPGQVLLLALFFRLFGVSDSTVAWMSGTFYILIPALTYFLGRRAFNARVGLLAGALAVVNNQLISFGLTGLSEVPTAFFLTCSLYSLYRGRNFREIFLTGALFGWLAILRSNTLPFLFWVGLFVALDPPEQLEWQLRARLGELWFAPKQPLLRLAALTLGFLLVFSPNAIRNYALIRNPIYNAASVYSLVFYTAAIEGKSSAVYALPGLEVAPVEYLLENPEQLASKMEYQLSRTLTQLFEGGIDSQLTGNDAVFYLLLIVGAIVPRPDENARRRLLRWLIYACLLTALVVGSMTFLRWRHLYGFVPVVLLLDTDFMLYLLKAIETRRQRKRGRYVPVVMIGSLVFLLVLGALGLVAASRARIIGDADNRDYRGVARWVRQNTPENALILAEQGDESFGMQNSLAWYTGREFIEYSEYTAQTIPAKRGAQPMYLLLISTDPKNRRAILATPELAGYTEVARLARENLPEAVLYASADVSLAR